MKEINLEKIIDSIANFNTDEDGNTIYYLWEVKKAMKQACFQVLDLAAENVNDINIDNIVFAETPEIALKNKNKLKTLIVETKNLMK